MKITICDLCKSLPDPRLLPVTICRFEQDEDWLGKPKEVKEICSKCLDKIFN